MKLKFSSILLVLVMLFAMLTMTACGDEEQETGQNVAPPTTITLYSIKGEGTTDEAIALVERELNRISKASYNTAIKLVLYSEAEYEAKIAEKMAAAKANPPSTNNKPLNPLGKDSYETTEVDGFVDYVYPDVTNSQLDIFLIRDQATYMEYVKNKDLANLQSMLSYDYSTLSSYINSYLMEAVKVNSSAYAVPNNHIISSYTYLLLNKELVNSLGFADDYENFSSIYDLKDYLQAVKAAQPSYVPLYNCPEPMIAMIEPDSMFGTLLNGDKYLDDNMPVALLTQQEYVSYLATKQAYEEMGYLSYKPSFDGTENCGAAFVSCMPNNVEELFGDEYYTMLYSVPTASTQSFFTSMYAISAYSVSAERAMEILSLINTHQEFRNIFQYGVEDYHFSRDEYSGLIHQERNDYNMNALYTGNGYLLDPCDTMTASELDLLQSRTFEEVKEILGDACQEQKWVGKRERALLKSINNALMTSPYHGFSINYSRGTVQKDLDDSKAFHAQEMAKIAAITYESYAATAEDLSIDGYISHLMEKYLYLGEVGAARFANITATGSTNTVASQFRTWFISNYPQYIYKPSDSTPVA